jgi:hypothetical protein
MKKFFRIAASVYAVWLLSIEAAFVHRVHTRQGWGGVVDSLQPCNTASL